jgi:glycosyltransferase involved in cell wall biosynthesis
MYDCTLIVPVYNEEHRVREFLVESTKYNVNYVFVSDGTDKTTDILYDHSDALRGYPQHEFHILKYDTRLGKGGAIIEGMKYTIKTLKSPYMGYIDVDLSTQITELVKMFDSLKNSKCDAVIGTRWSPGALIITPQPLFRRVLSRLLNSLTRNVFGLNLTDTQCGAKVFRTPHIERVIEKIQLKGFEFDVELLWRLDLNGAIICEFPVIWRNYTKDSKVKLICAVKMLKNLISLKTSL